MITNQCLKLSPEECHEMDLKIKEAKSCIANTKSLRHQQILSYIKSELPESLQKQVELLCRKGSSSWLTSLPLQEYFLCWIKESLWMSCVFGTFIHLRIYQRNVHVALTTHLIKICMKGGYVAKTQSNKIVSLYDTKKLLYLVLLLIYRNLFTSFISTDIRVAQKKLNSNKYSGNTWRVAIWWLEGKLVISQAINDFLWLFWFDFRFSICIKLTVLSTLNSFLHTVRVAYYEPAYYEHSFIMNQAEGPNKNNPIAFVLNKVRLIWSLYIMNKIFGPKGVHNKRPWLYIVRKSTQSIDDHIHIR